MKKLLYILLSLSLSTPVMAQTAGHKVDSIYVYNENDSLIYMQEWFYEGNNVTNEVQYTWDKEGVKHGDFNTFKAFDAKGNNVLYVTLDWDDVKQDWKGRGRFENVYNEDGKFSYHALWKEDQWKKDSIWLCQYNAQKQPILTLHQLFRNGEWQDQYKLIQDYDGSREIYHEEYSGRDANGLIGIKKWSQLYNGSTKISDHQYQWSGTAFVPSSWDTVGIVGGKTTLKESYVWTNGVQTGKSKEEWEFDGTHQTLHITYSGWEDGDFVPKEKQVDEWSGSTNTMTAKYNWDKTNKKWIGTTKTENLTSDGYTIKKTYKGWANNDFVPETIDSTKNENSKKVYYAKWTYNSSTKTWKGNSREIYAYEGSNQTLQEKYNSWNNGWIGSNGNKWVQIWKNGKAWSKVTYNWSSGWAPSIKDSTEYNGDDIIFSVHYKWTASAWEGDNNKSNYSQTYSSPGQKEWTITLKWENNQWTNFIQTRSIYEGGKLKEERSQQWNGAAWQDVKVVYHTWENGVEVFTRTEEWNAEAKALKMTSQYKHIIEKNAAGKKILDYEMSCNADSVWTGMGYYKNTWEYDNNGNEIGVAKYAWRNNNWGVDWQTSVIYLNGMSSKPLYKDRWKWDNSANVLIGDYKNEYDYDENLRQIMSRSWTWRGGGWYGSSYSETSFNEQGLTDTVTNYSYYQGNWVGATKHAYTYTYYDDNALLHEDIKFEYSRDGKYWAFSTKDEYLYFRGTSAGTRNYEYLEGDWSLVLINEYHYDDDAEAKLREEIHGTWSKGVVIKYERTHYFYNDDPK